jgi:peptidoglycan/xylan/chitin deacetylase (PgdA/CDA1 family)
MALGSANVARQALKRLVAMAPAPVGTVVLIYHRIGGGSGLEIDLDPAVFDQQLSELQSTGNVLPLAIALDSLQSAQARHHSETPQSETRRRETVVTFDDGTADFVDIALPYIVEHRIPVTLYLATAFVDEQRAFPDDGRPLSWNALRDACATGLVDVGSHTHSHAVLDRLPEADVAAELDRSKQLIEDRLGRPCADFAYPKALPPTPAADAAVRARFRSAALAGTRPNIPGHTDVYRIARSPVQSSDGMRYFERKAAGGMRLEDDMRRVLNRWRYRGVES